MTGPVLPLPVAPTPLELAPTMGSWSDLVETVTGCVACTELATGRTHVVPGVYPDGADVLLIGEAPGAQEDDSGVPFVGKAGQVLDALLGAAGLARDRVAVANVLKCRPPGNRDLGCAPRTWRLAMPTIEASTSRPARTCSRSGRKFKVCVRDIN